MVKVIYICLVIIISVSYSLSYADIFKYVDENGITLFTNVSRDSRYEKVISEGGKRGQGSPSLYNHIISGNSKRYNIEPSIIKAVITAESNWQPAAVSAKGAIGLMQLMPSTISDMRVEDPYDPEDNIEGGTKYLRFLLDMFKGDLKLALAAYNAGPGTVTKHGGIPPIKETRNYVRQVLSLHNGVSKSDASSRISKVTYDDGTVLYTNTPTRHQRSGSSKF